jgi:hypothetical protein
MGLVAADVDSALNRGELVVSWLNRGTLHLVAAKDYWWLHPLTTPQLRTANSRRLRQEGVTSEEAERAIDVVRTAVTQGPQPRAALRAHLEAAGIPTAGQALVHILLAATLGGHVVRGPMVGNDQAFVSVEAWLGPAPPPMDRTDALALLARRYLAGHAPASAEDLSNWSGITLRDARQGSALTGEMDPESGTELPSPRLLGPFDPLLHGWKSRAPFLGHHRTVITTNGVFRPVALVEGRVVGTWTLRGGSVTILPLESVRDEDMALLVNDAADVLRYLGLPHRQPAIAAPRQSTTVTP